MTKPARLARPAPLARCVPGALRAGGGPPARPAPPPAHPPPRPRSQELSKQLEGERLRKKTDTTDASAPCARLVVVANRLPVTPRRSRDEGGWSFERSSGGLVSAFLGVTNIDVAWVGWVGATIPVEERQAVVETLREQKPFACHPVFLDEDTADHFYNGFCNNVLWPLLHYIPLSMLDSHASVADLQWKAYQDANAAFADAVMSLNLSDSDQARDGLRAATPPPPPPSLRRPHYLHHPHC